MVSFSTRLVMYLMPAMLLMACQKQLCQQPADKRFTSLTDSSWRMVSSTDPSIPVLDRFNFRILQFNKNFTGAMNLVEDNEQYETPLAVFSWAIVSGRSDTVRLRFEESPSEGSDDSNTPPATSTFDYTYKLTDKLTLTESGRGYRYEMVPFMGIVDPDSKCSF